MNKWEKLFWDGTNYLIVPNQSADQSSCAQCAFDNGSECPKYEGPGRRPMNCLVYERATGKEAYLIPDTPESVADYIARSLSS